MKIPYTWLQDYIETDLEPNALGEKLTMAGLEVDNIERRWEKIITAKITWKEGIKGSDHLSATKINPGDGRELSVVCGAPNIAVGDIVPLALPGAQFVQDTGEVLTISAAKRRGVLSEGMLCSSYELGLSNDHSGIYILPPDTPLGMPLSEVVIDLDIKAHRGDLFSVTGVAREVAAFNRSHMKLPSMEVIEVGTETAHDLMKLEVKDEDLCPRFTARVIRDVKIGPSPLWLVRRLASAGVRSISNVVDVTNYVMIEMGQPLHAFDYDKVVNHHLIVRRAKDGEKIHTLDNQDRDLTPDMMIICDPSGPISVAGVMGGATSEVSDTTTTILLEAANWSASSTRRTSTRLGLRSEASSRFEKGLDPELAKLGLDRAARLLTELAQGKVAPGYWDNYPSPVTSNTLRFSARDCEWLLGYPVTAGEAAQALEALEFQVELDDEGDGMTVTVPTWRGDVREAADLVEEVARVLGYDRITGKLLSGELPEPQPENWFDRQERVRDIIAGTGCHEVVTYPLTNRQAMLQLLSDQSNVTPLLTGALDYQALDSSSSIANNGYGKGKSKGKKQPIEVSPPPQINLPTIPPEKMPIVTIVNPLSTRQESLRLTLMVSLIEILAENVRQGEKSVRIFEVSRRYVPVSDDPGALPHERRSLCAMLTGPINESWYEDSRETDFYDLKAISEELFTSLHVNGARYTPTQHPTFHPGRCALIELPVSVEPGVSVYPAGIIGELHPTVLRQHDLGQRVYALEIDLERVFAATPSYIHIKPLSRFPALTRDYAVVVDREVAAGNISSAIREAGGNLVQAVTLFDLYEGYPIPAGKRSLAFTVVYQSPERTLTEVDSEQERSKVVTLLNNRFNATLRE
jgi:phenylalanyl-tRNA synthetase beta chain